MAVSLKHTTVAVGTDAGNGEIAKAEWNEEHTLTLDSGNVLGRTSAGNGAVQEIPIGNLGLPAGCVIPFAGTSVPTGWIVCAGQAVLRSDYADLFTAIGTTYGAGDGSTTFNLPDLRGRVVAGKDDMNGVSANRLTDQSGGLNGDVLGDTGGSETHALVTAELAAHRHKLFSADPTEDGGSYANITGNWGNSDDYFIKSDDNEPSSLDSGSTGSGTAHNNVQPTIILNYIIKT